MLKKVLIVSNHFPPLNSMAAKRYGYMCKYFSENGYEPYVLTTYARGGGYINCKHDLTVPIDDNHIIRIGQLGIVYSIYNPLINYLVYLGKKYDQNQRIINEEDVGWFEKVKHEFDYNKFKNFDVIIGTYPSVGNILVAKHLASVLKIPYIVEIRDLISDYDERNVRTEFQKKVDVFLERLLIGNSAGIITVTEGFNKIISNRYPRKKVVTIFNGWDGEFVNNVSSHSEKYIYYAGGLYEHRVESLKLLFETIDEYDIDINVKIRSVGPEKFDEQLKDYIKQHNLLEKVEILEAVSEDIVKEEQSNSLINLLVSSLNADDQALMTTIPGKLFELIRAERPVLAIVDKSAELSSILINTKKGRALDQKEEIYNFIVNDYINYIGYRQEVKIYSRKEQARKLCGFLNEITR